jgi:endogenous inhibitor of DNA gyrase (YacG/DUF329 family)
MVWFMSRRADHRSGCPVCGKPVVAAHKPFCSTACRDRDLIAWLDGRYALPGPEDESALDKAEEDR